MKKSPLRRSGRLQTSDEGSSGAVVGEEDLPFLQPRSSIKAHREKHPGPLSEESSKATMEEQKKTPVTRRPGDVRKKTPDASDSEDECQREVPSVLLQRVKVPQEDVKVHTEGPTRIQGGKEGTPVKILGPGGTEPNARREMKATTDELRKRNPGVPRKVIDSGPQRQRLMDYQATRPDASKLKKTTCKPCKRSSVRWICNFVLPCLVLMTVVCWSMRDYIYPVSSMRFPEKISFSHLWGGQEEEQCTSDCSFVLVESIPVGLTFDPKTAAHQSIFQAWMDLMESARSSLDIAAFYFTLQGSDTDVEDPSTEQGEKVLQKLMELPSYGVELKLAINGTENGNPDTTMLAQKGADVKFVDLKSLTGGVVHTKLWIVDRKHIYIGSANMDWRSLTQVKELGAVLYNCSCLAQDLHKIFLMYRYLGEEGTFVPTTWPNDYSTNANRHHPRRVYLNSSEALVYISSSPAALCAEGRTSDLDAILSIIEDAQQFVYIAVMDYIPQLVYSHPKRFWPVIDDRLRSAACDRRVRVHLLVSCWSHSSKEMFVFLNSLSILSQEPLGCPIQVKLFIVPATEKQKTFPYSRVNHNKYMVTDRIAYIGTSNWSEDYFSNTAGVGLIINQTGSAVAESVTAQGQLKAVFERDWNSIYTQPLSHGTTCSTRNKGASKT